MAVNPSLQKSVDAMTAYMNTASSDLTDIAAKTAELLATIQTLQSTQGVLNDEDQALLDKAEAQAKAVSDQADAAAGKAPPPPPPPAQT